MFASRFVRYARVLYIISYHMQISCYLLWILLKTAAKVSVIVHTAKLYGQKRAFYSTIRINAVDFSALRQLS